MVMSYYAPGAEEGRGVDWSTIQEQALSPYEQYRARLVGQLGGTDRFGSRLETAAMRGFAPTYGRYLLENIAGGMPGQQGAYEPGAYIDGRTEWQSTWDQPFSQYVAEAPQIGYGFKPETTGPTYASPTAAGWADLVRASRAYRGGRGEEAIFDPAASYMSGLATGAVSDQPMGTQLGMAQAAMGMPTRGILGQIARSGLAGQLGRYRRAIATPGGDWFGRPEGGFAGWLGGQIPANVAGHVS